MAGRGAPARGWMAERDGGRSARPEWSIAETSGGDHLDAVRAGVRHVGAGDDEQEVGFPQRNLVLRPVVFPDQVPQFDEMSRPFVDLASAELDFDEGVAAVLQVQDGVRFEAVSVAVVRNGAALRRGIRPQIPEGEVFEEEAEGSQVPD